MEYIKQVRVLLLFIRTERAGNWDLHLHVPVSEMIPKLHAAGHLAYARSTWLYRDMMTTLPDTIKKCSSENFLQRDIENGTILKTTKGAKELGGICVCAFV